MFSNEARAKVVNADVLMKENKYKNKNNGKMDIKPIAIWHTK